VFRTKDLALKTVLKQKKKYKTRKKINQTMFKKTDQARGTQNTEFEGARTADVESSATTSYK
jgi:hypothetical protein